MKRSSLSLRTTVVGSYPAAPDLPRTVRDLLDRTDPFERTANAALDDQVRLGVDFPTDGQTRADMITLVAEEIRGLRYRGRWQAVAPVAYRGGRLAAEAARAKARLGGRNGLKVCVTGPYTLARSLEDRFYGGAERLARALAPEIARLVADLAPHADIVQLDEPFLSVEYPAYAADLVDEALAPLGPDGPVAALHVCGDASSILPQLADLPRVGVLDLECARNPAMLDALVELGPDRFVAVGCVRSDDPRVEDVGEIAAILGRAKEALGDRIMADPDCGLRNLPLGSARGKLAHMVEAARLIREGGTL